MSKISPVGRVSFPNLFVPSAFKNEEPVFDLKLIFGKEIDLTEMKKEAERVAKEKWGTKLPKDFYSPFRDGDESDRKEYQNAIYIRFKRKTEKKAPQVVDARKQPITQESGDMYAGCYARVSYSTFAWGDERRGGVSFGLNNVQKVRDGEPLDGRTNADQDFDALETEDEEVLF